MDEKKKQRKIEKFIGLCKMDQDELKARLKNILSSMGYKGIKNEDGFLYVKGTVPVLLVAHMDTVHEFLPGVITIKQERGETILSSPYGIGGDDRCGIYMVLEIIKDMKCSVLFCEDEEIGLIGARKFAKTKYINELGVNYIVEFDRKGTKDAVFYECDNPEFEKFVTESFFETAHGICSDISEVAPMSGIAAVNLSCGYYNAHRKDEFVVFEQMQKVVEEAKKMLKREVEKPFEYIEKQYYYSRSVGGYYGSGDWYDEWDGLTWPKPKNKNEEALEEYGIVFFNDALGDYDIDYTCGYSEDDALLEFLKWYKEVPYGKVIMIKTTEELERFGMI